MRADRTGAPLPLGARCASGARAPEQAFLRALMLMSASLQRMPRYTCSSMAPLGLGTKPGVQTDIHNIG